MNVKKKKNCLSVSSTTTTSDNDTAMTTRFADDCLPPERVYDSRNALFEGINSWAITRGYAFTTGKSTTEKSGRITVTFACDRCFRPPKTSNNLLNGAE